MPREIKLKPVALGAEKTRNLVDPGYGLKTIILQPGEEARLGAFIEALAEGLLIEGPKGMTAVIDKKDNVLFYASRPAVGRDMRKGAKKPLAQRYGGLDSRRLEFKFGGMERAFASAWEIKNSPRITGSKTLLRSLLHDNVSKRDAVVAATVIQWLGTNVGTSFLRDVIRKSKQLRIELGIDPLPKRIKIKRRKPAKDTTEIAPDVS